MADLDAVTDLVARFFEVADIAALGEVYCDFGGEEFVAAHRDAILESGRRQARALLERLPRGGASLYAGAGIAELVPMLAEVRLLERSVRPYNLRAAECAAVNAALARIGCESPRLVAADAAAAAGGFDHLCCVAVLTDPETFPQLAGVAYGRLPPVLVDVDAFVAERERASGLVDAMLAGLQRPGFVTTTFEEVAWFSRWADRHGAAIEADDVQFASPLVGDDVGVLRVG